MVYLVNPRKQFERYEGGQKPAIPNPNVRPPTTNPPPAYLSSPLLGPPMPNPARAAAPPTPRPRTNPPPAYLDSPLLGPPMPTPSPRLTPMGMPGAVPGQMPGADYTYPAPVAPAVGPPLIGAQPEEQFATVTINDASGNPVEIWTARDEEVYQGVVARGDGQLAVPIANGLTTRLARVDPQVYPEEYAFLQERLTQLDALVGTIDDPVADVVGGVVSAVPGAVESGIGAIQEAFTGDSGTFGDAATGAVQTGGELGQAATRPIAEAITGDFSSVSGPVGTALNATDIPRQIVVGGQIPGTDIEVPSLGEAGYQLATGGATPEVRSYVNQINETLSVVGVSMPVADFVAWSLDPANQAAIETAYTTGYTGQNGETYTGARGVWEAYAGAQTGLAGMIQRGLSDIVTDPLNWTGALAGLGSKLIKGGGALRNVDDLGRGANALTSAAGVGAQAVGQTARLPYNVLDRPLEQLVSGIGRLGMRVGDRIAPRTPQGELTQDAQRFIDPATDVLNREPSTVPPEPPPAMATTGPIPPPAPSAPTTTAPVPPPAAGPPVAAAPVQPRGSTFAPGSGRRPRVGPIQDTDNLTPTVVAPEPPAPTPPTQTAPTPPPPTPQSNLEVAGTTGEYYVMTRPASPGASGEFVAGPFQTRRLAQDALDAGPTPRETGPAAQAIVRTRQQVESAGPPDITPRDTPVSVVQEPNLERSTATGTITPDAPEQVVLPDVSVSDGPSTVPRTAAEREALPRELRPDRAGKKTIDRVARENPASFRAVTDVMEEEARTLIPRLKTAQQAAYARGDYSRMDEVLIESDYFANLQDAARTIARVDPDPIPLRRQKEPLGEVNRGGFNRGAEEPGRALERIIFSSWDETKAERSIFHRDGMFVDAPGKIPASGVESARRYVKAVDNHARLRPEDVVNSEDFQRALRQAQEVNTALGENAVPTKVVGTDVTQTQGIPQGTGGMGASTPLVTTPVRAPGPTPQRATPWYKQKQAEADQAWKASGRWRYQPKDRQQSAIWDLAKQAETLDEALDVIERAAVRDLGPRNTAGWGTETASEWRRVGAEKKRFRDAWEANRGSGASLGIIRSPEREARRMFGPASRKFKRYFELPNRTRDIARGGDALRYTDPDALGRQTLIGDVEAAVFDDPKLVFNSGKYKGRSWWDVTQEVAAKNRAAGNADPISEAIRDVLELAAKDRGVNERQISLLGRAIDGYLAYIREVTMYNPIRTLDQPITQYTGNLVTLAVTGNRRALFAALNPRSISRRFIKNAPTTELERLLSRFEVGMPSVTGGLDPAMTSKAHFTASGGGELATRRAAKKLLGEKMGAVVSYPVASQYARKLAVRADELNREALFTTRFRSLIPGGWDDLTTQVGTYASRHGIPEGVVTDVMSRNRRNPVGPSDLFLQLQDAARTAGVADRAAFNFAERGRRDWINGISRMRDDATAEVKRVFFSGEERGAAEKLLRRTFLFTYFTTRQSVLYAGEALKNPGMLAAYVRAAEGLKAYQEREGMPDYMRNFLRLPWATPWGYSLFINPVGLIATYLTFRDAAGEEDGFWEHLKNAGFLNPAITAGAQLLGLDSENFLTDPVALRTILKPAVTLLNEARSEGLLPGIIGTEPIFANPADRLWQWVRSGVSGAAEGIIPGAEHLPAVDPGANERTNFYYLMVSIAMEENGGDLAAAQESADAAIINPDSELYAETFNRWADENLWEYTANQFGAFRVSDRPPLKDDVAAASDVLRGEEPENRFQPAGETVTYPGTETPVTANPDDETPEAELAGAIYDTRQMASATEEARPLMEADNGWYEVGTPEGRESLGTWNDIAYGEIPAPIQIGGRTVFRANLSEMDTDTRRQLADLWAQENGVTASIEAQRVEQDAYLEANPEYAQFRDWRGNVYDAEGGVLAYWESIAADNPNAARYLEDQRARGLGPQALSDALTTVDAYLASEGINANVFDPEPADTNTGAYNPAAVTVADATAGTGGSGTGKPRDPAAGIAEDLATYQQEMAMVSGILAASGIPLAAIDGGSPMARQAAENVLAGYGIDMPSLSGDAEAYVQWAAQQGDGDSSIQAFLAWKGENDALITTLGLPFLLGMGDLSGFPTGGSFYGGGSSGGFGGSSYGGSPRLRRDFFGGGDFGSGPLIGSGATRLSR